MNLEFVKNRIKAHEGFRSTPYYCTAGKLTVCYGHMVREGEHFCEGIEYDKAELEELFNQDFKTAFDDATNIISEQGLNIPDLAKEVLIEMCFQLGKPRVSKFKKMLAALKDNKFQKAADEMIDSRWHKQTPERCKSLANIMRGLLDK